MFGTAQARERAEIFSALTALVHAGVSIGEALTTLAEEAPPSPMRRALSHVGHEVSGGEYLSVSFKHHPDMFSPLTITMVEVGERGGRLEESLRAIADYHERDYKLRSLLKRELTYPFILLIAILFIPLLARALVVWISESLGAALLAGGGQLALYLLFLGVPVLLISLVINSIRQSQGGRLTLDRIKLSLPLIGKVARKLAVARFCRALASLYSAGVMMGTSLRLAAQASGNEAIESELGASARRVETGGSLAEALAESSLLPATVLRMLKTGEETGDVDSMAHHAADHLEQEAETSIRQMAVASTPVAVLIAGIIVGAMVVSFYVKLYSF